MGPKEYDNYSRNRSIPMNTRSDIAGLTSLEINDESNEKPWQKKVKQGWSKMFRCFEPTRPVPSIVLLLLLGGYLTLGYLTQLIEDEMPRPILDTEIQRDDWQTFSEEAARDYLDHLLGNGPRVAGTKYHLEKTEDLKALIDSIAGRANLPVRTDWQFVSDDFWLEFSTPYVISYHNLSNIIAVLEGESGFDSVGNIGSSLLVNCHYDSVPFAIGASDNGVFCAVMLETLSKLSRRREKFLHNIVFLFNGAEENPLMGSHGFLSHPWSRGISSVVNLDAAGMNGKPTIFQVTDPRLIDAYKYTTQRPNAQSLGEFLFKSGIIPSDTDFRIWRDFGDIHGVDMAFTKWGSVYHTRNDRPQLILDGVVQNAGDMLLGMLSELGSDPEMGEKVPVTSMVFYDYLNLFLVTYSNTTAQIVDILICLMALLTIVYYLSAVGFRRSAFVGLAWAGLGRILGLVGGILTVVVVTVIMLLVDQLRYLSRPWLVVPFYWIPCFIGSLIVTMWYGKSEGKGGLSRSLRALEAMAATRFLLAIFLLILAILPSMASLRYIIAVPLAAMSVASMITTTAVRWMRLAAWQHLILEFLLSLPPIFFVATTALRLNAILIPTMGRTPVDRPDFVVGGVNLALAIMTAVIVSGIELLFSRKRIWLPIGLVSAICVILMLIPLAVYEEDGIVTQRHYWFHSEIVSYDFSGTQVYHESGVVVPRQDAHTLRTVRDVFTDEKWKDIRADCEKYVHCNLPLMRPRFERLLNNSLFLYSGPPARFEPAPSLNATRICNEGECTLHFVMTGSAHNVLTILPLNAEMINWSLATPLQSSSYFAGKPLYLIFHSTATFSSQQEPFHFKLTFNMTNTSRTQPLVEISHHAHKMFHPEDFTEEYRNLLSKTPKYFNVASTLSIRTNYVF